MIQKQVQNLVWSSLWYCFNCKMEIPWFKPVVLNQLTLQAREVAQGLSTGWLEAHVPGSGCRAWQCPLPAPHARIGLWGPGISPSCWDWVLRAQYCLLLHLCARIGPQGPGATHFCPHMLVLDPGDPTLSSPGPPYCDWTLGPSTGPPLPYVLGLDLRALAPMPPGLPHHDWALGSSATPAKPCILGSGTWSITPGLGLPRGLELR